MPPCCSKICCLSRCTVRTRQVGRLHAPLLRLPLLPALLQMLNPGLQQALIAGVLTEADMTVAAENAPIVDEK